MLAYEFSHQARKLVVYGVSGACCNDAALDGFSDESHVADYVEQLVACTFVLPYQRFMLNVTDVVGIHVSHSEEVGQLVKTLLSRLTLIDNDGVVEVAALDVSYEYEGASSRNLLGVVLHIVERSKLAIDELRLERAHGGDRELLVGQDGDNRTCFLVFHLMLVTDDVVVFRRVLLFDSYLLNLVDIHDCGTVEDRELRTVYLHQAIVYSHCVKC